VRIVAIYVRAILMSSLVSVCVAGQTRTEWVDPSPHTLRFVRVDPDVSIEILDWGGTGPAMVLLAQLGQTAHIYDDWAPRLARTYRVLGITRRGYGESSAPPTGYSMERLATDIVTVLDVESLQNPFLVGNGFAGEEMSWIASRFQRRTAGLIYLDAAYDRTNAGSEGAIARRIPPRPPGPRDLESAESMTRWVSGGIGFPIPEAEIRQMVQFVPDGRVAGERTPGTVRQAIVAGIVKADYSNIRVPALAIYARPVSADAFPGCRGTDDAAVRQACSELYAWALRHLSDGERLFRTIPSRVQVIDLPGANPFVFLSNEREVTQALDQFVSAVAR